MKKFDHLEVKEMLTTRWTQTAWYQSKVFGDAMLTIMEKHLNVDWGADISLDYYASLYDVGVNLTNALPFLYDDEGLVYLGETPTPACCRAAGGSV